MNLKDDYDQKLESYSQLVKEYSKNETYSHTIECSFEALSDWSIFSSLEEVKLWFESKKASSKMIVEDIPMNQVSGWFIDHKTGNIHHKSKDFFTIHGVRVTTKTRENSFGWEQPILEQVGYDGGLLGIIRKRFQGIPHYLCEAKEEPGNYGKVQISPTLQATFANLKQSHGGRKPHFSDLFINKDSNTDVKILFDSWLAEDGGRLHLKRNRGILVEVDEQYDIELPNDNFIWLSLYQIKQLMKEDAWVNPHVRGILAHV